MVAVALLRAVNVGGTGKVAMTDLAAMFRSLGLGDVKTLLATGNVLFDTDTRDDLEAALEAEAERRLGLRTTFFVRTEPEWSEAVASNPFEDMAERDPSHLVLVALKNEPPQDKVGLLSATIAGRETVRLFGRHLYACYPDGIGNSKLTMPAIERALGVQGTGRNWNTVLKIAAGFHGRR